MSRLSDLVRQVAKSDPQLAADIAREVKVLERRRAFGLNFERHVPETVDLPGRAVRRGEKVRFLPPRDVPATTVDHGLWIVTGVRRDAGRRVAELVRRAAPDAAAETTTRDVEDLVVVAEFRDPIYPGLVSTGKVARGGPDKPFHTVINAENFHALEALTYTHEGRVDAIYIDPPYNTGARDWKYNNDYVDGDDLYRHSKWLAFMERRLKLAKRLLNPENSVLIVTIDEKEHLRLGLLLQQLFPEAQLQTVTCVINPSGASGDGFSRVDEYLFYVFIGDAEPAPWVDNMLVDVDHDSRVIGGLSWESFLRSGRGNVRSARPNLCYPIVIDRETRRIVDVGSPLQGPDDARPREIDGNPVAWPVRNDGSLGMWRRDAAALRDLVEKGYAYVSSENTQRGTFSIKYLLAGTIRRIEAGEIEVSRTGEAGQVIGVADDRRLRVAKTVWNRTSHNAGKHGTDLLRLFIPRRRFPYPKSLYAVEDSVRFAVADKPDAIVLDFFAGSGTTAHAVMRLNKQDGGRRQCISVTNNEVSAEEQAELRRRGLRPGDPEWERHGICDYITKPRIQAAITGLTPEGEPIRGDYRFTDEFPMAEGFEENAEFFTLTYESRLPLAHHRSFERIAPLLWLKAGAQGRRIQEPTSDFDVADTYAVLFDLDASHDFIEAVAKTEGLRMAFIRTDDERAYQDVCAELPGHLRTERLYSGYLSALAHGTRVD